MNLLLSDPAFLSVAATISGGGGGYDPDAAAYIARVEGASGDNQALETAVKDAINAFVVGCKADGIWSAIEHSCILAGARTLNGALQPLVGTAPTNNNFVGIGTDYDRKIGLIGDGGTANTKYLGTNVNTNFTALDNLSMSCYVTAAATNSASYMGNAYAGNSVELTEFIRINTSTFVIRNRKVLAYATVSPDTGFFGSSRASLSEFQYRANGVPGTVSSTAGAANTSEFQVFRRPASTYSNVRLAFYHLGEALNLDLLDARVTTLINAFAAAIP